MIIDRNLEPYIVRDTSSVQEVASHIAKSKGGIAFIVDSNGVLLGTVSNGDLVRWAAASSSASGAQTQALEIASKEFKRINEGDETSLARTLLKDVLYIPKVDAQGRLQAVIRERKPNDGLQLPGRTISKEHPAYIIAEIGNNHNGSLERAIELIDAAADAGADCAKFQMRDMDALYGEAKGGSDSENLGTEYVLDLLAKYQLKEDELYKCFDHCASRGLIPLCTPWDQASVDKLEAYGIPAYKVASADLTNHELLKYLAETGKPLICSTGMSTESEIKQSVTVLQNHGAQFALLHCNSTYPTPFKDINLNYLQTLEDISGSVVGYSGHERDIFVPVAAVAQGASIVEKHFTFDKTMEGSDHKVSLLPDEFARMVEGIRQVEEAKGTAGVRQISQGELINRVNLAKSLFAIQDIPAGTVIQESMLETRSPGRGLQPNMRNQLIGLQLGRDVKAGTPFFPSDLNKEVKAKREGKYAYQFGRPWGLPVRHHDYSKLLKLSEPDFLEFHLSYKDLDLDDTQYFDGELPIDLVVHAPELFAGDHVLDLCSPDKKYRELSIENMKRVLDKTRSLRRFFRTAENTGIVTNIGGFSEDRPLTAEEKAVRIDHFRESLLQLDTTDVAVWPQTMPPYPWHFGGQRFHNLFVEADEIVSICNDLNLDICFDTSHSKLACNTLGHSFTEFVKAVSPLTKHLHVADALGKDGEGLQVGDGDTDFKAMFDQLAALAPSAFFLPEIWQGHENDGEGFWIALDRLQKIVS